jgi:hypothetical protein
MRGILLLLSEKGTGKGEKKKDGPDEPDRPGFLPDSN